MIGDCDDFAILMAAVIEAIGGTSRIVLARHHAYTEVYLGLRDKPCTLRLIKDIQDRYAGPQINYHVDWDGEVWLNLDWTAKYPGGPFFKGKIIRIIYP